MRTSSGTQSLAVPMHHNAFSVTSRCSSSVGLVRSLPHYGWEKIDSISGSSFDRTKRTQFRIHPMSSKRCGIIIRAINGSTNPNFETRYLSRTAQYKVALLACKSSYLITSIKKSSRCRPRHSPSRDVAVLARLGNLSPTFGAGDIL